MSGMEISYVPYVENVEATVGQGNALTSVTPLEDALMQFVARNNFGMGMCAQSTPNVASKCENLWFSSEFSSD